MGDDLLKFPMAECILDGKPAVGKVDGFLLRRKEATVPVCAEHLLKATLYEKLAQKRIRDFLGKSLRVLGIPKGAIPRIRARVK